MWVNRLKIPTLVASHTEMCGCFCLKDPHKHRELQCNVGGKALFTHIKNKYCGLMWALPSDCMKIIRTAI